MEGITQIAAYTSAALEALGIAAILIVAFTSTASAGWHYFKQFGAKQIYARYRQQLGRGILIGLEFLVAADIINSIAVEPTLSGVAVLGAIVAIRTFLSFTLEVEMTGRWPWERVEGSKK